MRHYCKQQCFEEQISSRKDRATLSLCALKAMIVMPIHACKCLLPHHEYVSDVLCPLHCLPLLWFYIHSSHISTFFLSCPPHSRHLCLYLSTSLFTPYIDKSSNCSSLFVSLSTTSFSVLRFCLLSQLNQIPLFLSPIPQLELGCENLHHFPARHCPPANQTGHTGV